MGGNNPSKTPSVTRYDLLYLTASPLIAPYLFWRAWRQKKYSESFGGMLGRQLPDADERMRFQEGSVWVHAVSVGEVMAAQSILPELRKLMPSQYPFVISTITETGQAAARRCFANDYVTYFPIDFSWKVKRFQQVLQPSLFVMMETELWPNFLGLAQRRGTPCFLINGRLSDRSFPKYYRFRKLLKPAFDALCGICAQTDADAEKFFELGIPRSHIRVCGNVKFDIKPSLISHSEKTEMMQSFCMRPSRQWIVVGSTHPTEETMLFQTFKELLKSHPNAGLLICPRHPERFDIVTEEAQQTGLRTHRVSDPVSDDKDPQIVILDKMGMLARAYGLGTMAIVAGSFCDVGGHNLLEAAAHKIPVIFGPKMHSQREIDRAFKKANAGIQVTSDQLLATFSKLFNDEAWRTEQSLSGFRVVEENRGAAVRSINFIAKQLGLPENIES